MKPTGISRGPTPGGSIDYSIREASESDEAFLREMLYLALYVPPGETPLPRSVLGKPTIARYVEGWGKRPQDRGWIGLAKGEPVGAAWLRCFSASGPGYGFVSASIPELSIAVLPEHRGRGLGTKLLDRLIEDAPTVSLSCDPRNPAWQLYLRAGFRPIEGGRTMLLRS